MTDAPEKFDGYIVRGKTPAEIIADQKARVEWEAEVFTINLTRKQIRDVSVSAFEAEYLLLNASDIMEFLRDSIAGGHADMNDAGLLAILDMSSRGFRMAADKDGAALSDIAPKFIDHEASRNGNK